MANKRKQRESFGAIRQRDSGRYQASYTGLDGTRYNAPHTFDTMTDARGWLSIQRAKLLQGEWSPTDAAQSATAKASRTDTLAEYARTWLETRVNRHGEGLRPRTRVEYERLLAGPLSTLATERLAMITPSMVRTWYSDHLKSGKQTQAARAW